MLLTTTDVAADDDLTAHSAALLTPRNIHLAFQHKRGVVAPHTLEEEGPSPKAAVDGDGSHVVGAVAACLPSSVAPHPSVAGPSASSQQVVLTAMKRADVWALGVTLYAIRYGRLPWPISSDDAGGMCDYMERVVKDPPGFPMQRSSLDDIIGSMLNKDPDMRFTAAQAHDAVKALCYQLEEQKLREESTLSFAATTVGSEASGVPSAAAGGGFMPTALAACFTPASVVGPVKMTTVT